MRAAELARAHGMRALKLYEMVGLPGETDDDIDELVRFARELSKIVPLALGVAPFVAKRNTPLDGTPFAGIARGRATSSSGCAAGCAARSRCARPRRAGRGSSTCSMRVPAIGLSISDRTCCAWQVAFAFPFPKDHAAVVAQASCRWGHRTSCPVFQTPQATCLLLKIQQVRRPAAAHRQDVVATTTIGRKG